MCLQVYLSSKKEIPEIPYSDNSPGFYVRKIVEKNEIDMIRRYLSKGKIYQFGSFMGCACGLEFDAKHPGKDYALRIENVDQMFAYIGKHKKNNELKLYGTWWEEFPAKLDMKKFKTTRPKEMFEFDAKTLYTID